MKHLFYIAVALLIVVAAFWVDYVVAEEADFVLPEVPTPCFAQIDLPITQVSARCFFQFQQIGIGRLSLRN